MLGFAALDVFQFEIARKAFIRTRDLKFLTLISFLQVTFKAQIHFFIKLVCQICHPKIPGYEKAIGIQT